MKEDKGGIYGIYVNSELVYIGKTNNFANRFKQHNRNLKQGKDLLLYNILSNFSNYHINFIPLVYANDNKRELNQKEIDLIEYGLIKALNPKGNIQFKEKNRQLEVYSFEFDQDVYLWDEKQLHPELIDKDMLSSFVECIEEEKRFTDKQKLELYSGLFKYLCFYENPNSDDYLIDLIITSWGNMINSYSILS